MTGVLSRSPSLARVTNARYTSSRTVRFAQCTCTGRYDGMSSVTSQGPLSAVASSWPLALACCAMSARADSGRPSASSSVVSSLV